MLMTDEITARARELLAALQAGGGWMSRAELARATGKSRLSPHDIDLLDRLVNAGQIDKQERPSNTPVGTAFEYRVKG